jgi:hypothetical protein
MSFFQIMITIWVLIGLYSCYKTIQCYSKTKGEFRFSDVLDLIIIFAFSPILHLVNCIAENPVIWRKK